jgi:hypothetical protein
VNNLLDIKQAAVYCRDLPVKFLRNQIKRGRGPAYLKVSPHRIYFQIVDLEAWMSTWENTTPSQHKDSL